MIANISIQMKSGSRMDVQARATVYRDSYGSGERFVAVEDVECMWPGSYRVIPENMYDVEDAIEQIAGEL